MTNLVVIETKETGVIEMSQYTGNKFGSTISVKTEDLYDLDDLKALIEDYRVTGLQVLA